jgi:hypothetical protein
MELNEAIYSVNETLSFTSKLEPMLGYNYPSVLCSLVDIGYTYEYVV